MTLCKIALLGTGIMGAPMARNIAAAGYQVSVWNRTPARAENLADVAGVAGSVGRAVAGADAVITMLADAAAVTDVLFGAGGAAESASEALFIDMSSIQPAVARDHAARLKSAGARHLDAPVSGGEKGAVEATLAIMVGGDKADFACARTLLSSMGRATHVGGHGAGQTAKLANQVIVAVSIGAVAEALLLARKGGCDPAAVREALIGGFATSPILELHGERMLKRNWTPGGAVRMQLKDLNNALQAARQAGITLPLTEASQTAYDDLAERMDAADLDHSAYMLWLEAINSAQM